MTTFTAEQLGNAQIIRDTAAPSGPVAVFVAVLVALDESSLVNVGFGDISAGTGQQSTSLGLYQQTAHWGLAADRMDPVKAVNMFLHGGAEGQRGLLDIPGWDSLAAWDAAQQVQGSQYDGVTDWSKKGAAYGVLPYAQNYKDNMANTAQVLAQIGGPVTPRYPGALWLPTGDNGPMPNSPDAGSLHIAVTRADSVFGWVQTEKACHAYNAQYGRFEQYMDFDRIAYGVKDGNSHVITVESFDGLLIHNDPNYWEEGLGGVYGTSADTGVWDDGQAERAADFIAWCNLNLGIALEQSNRAGNPGWGPHRLGIEPWRSNIYGAGESWTNHDGKPCPGNLRVAQIPSIVARAQVIRDAVKAGRCDWLPQGEVDVPSALARTGGSSPAPPAFPWPPPSAATPPTPPPPPKEWSDMASKEDIQAAIAAALKTDTHTNASGWNVFAPNGRGIGASVNGSRVWSGLTPQSWQALQKACAAAGQTYLNWGSLPSAEIVRLFGKQV